MRILYTVHGYKPAYRIGGPIESVSAAAEMLVQRGHEVTVLTTNCNLDEDLDVPVDQPIDVDGVTVWYFRREEPLQKWAPFISYLSRSMGFLYAPKMAATLRRLVPQMDLVTTHLPFVYPTYAGARAARQARKPLFYYQRGVFGAEHLKFRSLKKRIYIELIERPIMRRATTLIALTEAEVASYRRLGVDTPCRVIPNGVDVRKYRIRPSARPACLAGVADDTPVVLFMGRLHPHKGADRLLEAFTKLAAVHPKAVLVMAGPDEWGLVEQFRQGVSGDIQARVLFPGMVTGDDKRDLLARADLFCLPSDGEGFSIAILEAMASSTAVLISPGCHFADVESRGAGRVVSTSAAALADAIIDLLSDRDRLRVMGERGLALVTADYTWEAIVSRIEAVYREGVERAGR
jgi:glycosyltransferase involved in cell wall biosynthesis